MTTVFPTNGALPFPDLLEIKVEKNGKRGQWNLKEMAVDRYDKAPEL